MSTPPQNNPQTITPNTCAPQPIFPIPPQTTTPDCNCLPPLPYYAQPSHPVPSPRNPAYALYVYSASSGITYPSRTTYPCDGSYATIPAGNTIILEMSTYVSPGSQIRITVRPCSGYSSGTLYVYMGNSPTSLSAVGSPITVTTSTTYASTGSPGGYYIALSVTSGCVEVDCVITV